MFKNGRIIERKGFPIFGEDGYYYGWAWYFQDITDRLKLDLKFQNVIEQATDIIGIFKGENLVIEVANDALLKLWQVGSEVFNKPIEEILPEIKDQGFMELMRQVIRTGEPYHGYEIPAHFDRSGGEVETLYFNFRFQPYREMNGSVTGILMIGSDVTDQISSRKQLEESESRFRNMVEQAPVAIAVYQGGNFVAEVANNTYLNIIGKTKEETLGKSFFEVLPELKESLEPIAKELVRTGTPYSTNEYEVVLTRNGITETCYFNYIWDPYYEIDRSKNGFIIVATEVTEQVKSRKKVEDSVQELGKLANAMPQIVWSAEPDGSVIYYNDRILEFAGASRLPDGSWNWVGVLHPEDTKPTEEAWMKAFTGGTIYQMEHRVIMRDGSYRWHLSRALPQHDDKGDIIKWYGTATDVHEQKLNEEALELKNVQLLRTNSDLDNFIYTASHDLKAPIANIEGYLRC